MRKKIYLYLETFEKCPGPVYFPLFVGIRPLLIDLYQIRYRTFRKGKKLRKTNTYIYIYILEYKQNADSDGNRALL